MLSAFCQAYGLSNSTYAAFNRLTLEVAYGASAEEAERAVRNAKVSLDKYKTLAEGQKADIRILNLILTNNCNFNCKYCYETGAMHGSKLMSPDIAKKAIDVLYDLPSNDKKPYYLYFYGGEPLLNFKVLKYAALRFKEEASRLHRESYMGLVTNGSLLTMEMANFFKEMGIDLAVSLDGQKIITDSQRIMKNGSSAYDAAANAIAIARAADLKFDISFTIGRHNISCIKTQIDYLEREFHPQRIMLNIPVVRTADDLNLARQALKEVIKLRKYLWERDNTDAILPRFAERFVEKDLGWMHCPCQRHQIVVGPEGATGPCLMLYNNNAYFRLKIDQISEGHMDNGPFTELMSRIPVNIKNCRECPALMLCRGGCAANAVNLYNTLLKPDPLMCSSASQILENFIWDAEKMRSS